MAGVKIVYKNNNSERSSVYISNIFCSYKEYILFINSQILLSSTTYKSENNLGTYIFVVINFIKNNIHKQHCTHKINTFFLHFTHI